MKTYLNTNVVYCSLYFTMIFYRAHSVGEAESNNSRLVVLRMNKNDLDDAHKDKQNKIFSSDFKVIMRT